VSALGELAKELEIAEPFDHLIHVREVLGERDVVRPWLHDSRVLARVEDHRGSKCGRLELTRRDDVDHHISFVRSKSLVLDLFEGCVRVPTRSFFTAASIDPSKSAIELRSRSQGGPARRQESIPALVVDPVALPDGESHMSP
jgi:hypothetical protein